MIIDRYLAAQIGRPFSVGVGLLVVVFADYSSSIRLAEAADGLFQISTAVRLIMLNTFIAVEILLPTALYFAVLSAVSRLYRDLEMIALHTAGVSELRILGSVFKFSVVIALVVGSLSLFVRPWAYGESYRFEAETVADFDVHKMEADQFLELQDGEYTLFARDIDYEQSRLKEVFLQQEKGNKSKVIYAKEAYVPPVKFGAVRSAVFYDDYSYLLDRKGHRDVRVRFKKLSIHLQVDDAKTGYKRKAEPTGSLALSDQRKDIAEYQWRLTTPLTTLLLGLLAVPLSRSGPRQGRFGSFFVAILVYALLFNLASVVRNMIEEGYIDPLPGLLWVYAGATVLLAALVFKPVLRQRQKNA